MRVRAAGPAALLVETGGSGAALALAAAVRAAGLAVVDVVPGAETVLLDGVEDEPAVRAFLRSWRGSGAVPEGRLVEVPMVYDGPDLPAVARRWRLDVAAAVAQHAGLEHRVAFCGFAPGFPYCTGLPADRAVPRRDRPRPRVPAGSVGLAGRWTGIYPTASPGGWQLIGRTDLRLWDAEADPPAALPPGTRVRFVPVCP